MNPYKVKITAGGMSKWLGSTSEEPFTTDQDKAEVFKDNMPDFYKYVLSDARFDDFHNGDTYDKVGLESIEFVFQS
jgi:hypothetical protein